jgi:hypothetical protein
MSLSGFYPSLIFLIHIQRWIMIQYRQAFTKKPMVVIHYQALLLLGTIPAAFLASAS